VQQDDGSGLGREMIEGEQAVTADEAQQDDGVQQDDDAAVCQIFDALLPSEQAGMFKTIYLGFTGDANAQAAKESLINDLSEIVYERLCSNDKIQEQTAEVLKDEFASLNLQQKAGFCVDLSQLLKEDTEHAAADEETDDGLYSGNEEDQTRSGNIVMIGDERLVVSPPPTPPSMSAVSQQLLVNGGLGREGCEQDVESASVSVGSNTADDGGRQQRRGKAQGKHTVSLAKRIASQHRHQQSAHTSPRSLRSPRSPSKSASRGPFFEAAARGDVSTLKSLLGAGHEVGQKMKINNVDCADQSWRTALHIACAEGQTSAVRFLVAMGANVCAENAEQNISIEVAEKAGHKHIVMFLSHSIVTGGANMSSSSMTLHFVIQQSIDPVLFENQRYQPLRGWKGLFPTDRKRWSDREGVKSDSTDFDPKAHKMVLAEGVGDDEGWEYAVDFPYFDFYQDKTGGYKKSKVTFVRRRQWVARPTDSSDAFDDSLHHGLNCANDTPPSDDLSICAKLAGWIYDVKGDIAKDGQSLKMFLPQPYLAELSLAEERRSVVQYAVIVDEALKKCFVVFRGKYIFWL
jgi:hypothetical protein